VAWTVLGWGSELRRFHLEISALHSIEQWASMEAHPNRFLSFSRFLQTVAINLQYEYAYLRCKTSKCADSELGPKA
jgi:hypothetical protein